MREEKISIFKKLGNRSVIVPAKFRVPLVVLPFIHSFYSLMTDSGIYWWVNENIIVEDSFYYPLFGYFIQVIIELIPVTIGIQIAAFILSKKHEES